MTRPNRFSHEVCSILATHSKIINSRSPQTSTPQPTEPEKKIYINIFPVGYTGHLRSHRTQQIMLRSLYVQRIETEICLARGVKFLGAILRLFMTYMMWYKIKWVFYEWFNVQKRLSNRFVKFTKTVSCIKYFQNKVVQSKYFAFICLDVGAEFHWGKRFRSFCVISGRPDSDVNEIEWKRWTWICKIHTVFYFYYYLISIFVRP